MRIKMLTDWFWNRGMLNQSNEYDLPNEQAETLISLGKAERLEPTIYAGAEHLSRAYKRGRNSVKA